MSIHTPTAMSYPLCPMMSMHYKVEHQWPALTVSSLHDILTISSSYCSKIYIISKYFITLVAGIASLLRSHFPDCTNNQIRNAMVRYECVP